MSPRCLVITDQPAFASLLEHHITTVWPAAELRRYGPERQDALPAGFTAAGYDVVLLDHEAQHGQGLRWLAELGRRSGIPPIVYFAPAGDGVLGGQARQAGALECVSRERIDHHRFVEILREALDQRRRAVALWRSRPESDLVYRFGTVRIRGHRCLRRLAASANSQVFLAESEKAGELVVLKVFGEVPDKVEAYDTFNRFLQEYELVSRIRHPNVVRIHDLGVADDHAYIAMEYFPRGDLRARMKKAITPRQALVYVAQIAGALEAIHSVGVLHRDLKPGNVMMRGDGSIALIDFGLAKQLELEAEITGTGEIFGTPYYMSPEQGHAEAVDPRSDFYSLGVIFYEMLMRRRPYLAPSVMAVIYLHRHAPLPQLEEGLKRYEPLLHGLLAKKPAERFQSAAEISRTIDTLLAADAA